MQKYDNCMTEEEEAQQRAEEQALADELELELNGTADEAAKEL